MDPNLMRMASEQFAKMSPEQRRAMQEQAANINPAMASQMMSQMGNIRPDDLSRAMEQMQGMSASDISAAAAGASGHSSATEKYKFSASESLKLEGNALHKAGKFEEAGERYTRAIANLEGNGSPAAVQLKRACQGNYASCCLKLGQWKKAEGVCTDILKADVTNAKALYRRGTARKEMKRYRAAVEDFKASLDASPGDETIAAVLTETNRLVEENSDELEGAEQGEDKQVETTSSGGVTIQEITEEDPPLPTSTPVAFSSGSAPAPAMHRAETLDAMKQNPEMLKTMGETVKNMSPEQLEALASMQGHAMPAGMTFTPEMMKMAGDMMSNLSPEDLERMMEGAAAAQQHRGGVVPNSSSSSGAAGGGGAAVGMGMPSATPSAAAGMGMPEMTPEMMAKMEEQMQDPKAMEAMSNMMSSMSPESLVAMSKQMGKEMSLSQAEQTLKMMKGMKPEHMKKMMQAAKLVEKTSATVKKVTGAFVSREALILALVMLAVAILLNFLGLIG